MLPYLTKEQKRALIRNIQGYFQTERDEEIGLIAAENFLEFIIQEIGPYFYNRALRDIRSLIETQRESFDTELLILERPVERPPR